MTSPHPSAHPFDKALQLETLDDNTRRGRTHPEWANMVGPFGGITTAVLLQAIQTHPDRLGDPLAVTVNFAAPIADGEFDIRLRAARTNRSNQHWIAELSQHGQIKTTATAVFGGRRDTWSDTEARPPAAPAPESIAAGRGPDMIVAWARLYEMRFVQGALSGLATEPTPTSPCTLWVRDRAQRPVDYPALAALCDVLSAGISTAGRSRAGRHDFDDDLLPRRCGAARRAGRRLRPGDCARSLLCARPFRSERTGVDADGRPAGHHPSARLLQELAAPLGPGSRANVRLGG